MADKAAIREEALRRRREMSAPERLAAGEVVARRLDALADRLEWRLVSCYLGFDAEVPTEGWLLSRLARGTRVAVPWVDPSGGRLFFSELRDPPRELEVNRYGIKEPGRRFLRILPPASFDAIIVPGVVFDRSGHRLGYGRGHYDRCLAEPRGRVPLVGLAFSGQVVDGLPAEPHDVPVDLVVTEGPVVLPDRPGPFSREASLIEEVA